MPLKDRYFHAKDGLKRRLGMSSPGAGLASLSAEHPGGTPNPAPGVSQPTPTSTANTLESGLPSSANMLTDASTAWSGLRTLLKVVDSSADVFPPLKSAVGGLSACIEVFEDASKGRREYTELLAKLDSLMADLSGGLDHELRVVQGKNTRDVVRRHLEAVDESDDLIKSYRRIQGYLERLSMNANLSVWQTVSNLAIEARLRGLMPALAAVYNSAESEVVQRRSCTPGTREQELTKLLDWARNEFSDARDIYWMNGMAGTGKTTIAYSLCAELEASAELGASFFCSRLIPDCRNVKLIFPSIAYQLARFSRPFCYALSAILESEPDVHTRVLRMQFENLLVKPLIQVKETLPTDFVIVIDALDECGNEDSVGQILDVLLSYTTGLELPARFLVSSRPESEIYRRMMARVGNNLNARLVLHDLDAQIVKRDIEVYLRAELTDVDLSPSQMSALVGLSGVLFIFASTAARYIKEGLRYMEHEDRLNTILGLSSEDTDSKDKEIDKLYTTILRAAFENESIGNSTRSRLKMILDTIICAQEPMTIHGLAGLLRLKSGGHVDALLRTLSSVINISASREIVTTLHASFPDYMLDHERSASFHCNSASTHTRLSHQCFGAIKNQDPQFNIYELESSYLRDEEVPDLMDRVDKAVSSHLFYACRYWIAHLEHGNASDETDGLFWDFLTARLLLWMEILNGKKSIYLGPSILQRAETWSKLGNHPRENIDIVHDAWRFITVFAGSPVSLSTAHIYVSMVPFWPQSAPVSKHYSSLLQNTIQPRGTGIAKRQLALLATWRYKAQPYSMCFSPDGSLIALDSLSGPCIINGATGNTVLGPLPCNSTSRSVAFSPDGKLLVSGFDDKTIRVWNSNDGTVLIESLTGHTASVIWVSFFPDGSRIASGSDDKTIRVWDIDKGGVLTRTIEAHDGSVRSVCVTPDGSRIGSGSEDQTVRVWDVNSGTMVFSPLTGHTASVTSVCFSPDGTQIVSGSRDNTVRIWDVLMGQLLKIFEGHIDPVYCVAFSPDGSYIASASRDLTIRLWDAKESKGSARVLRGHTNDVLAVSFSPDGTRIVSGSMDMTIRSWDVETHGPKDLSLQAHTQRDSYPSPSNNDFRVISRSIRKVVHVWDLRTGELVLGPLRGHTDIVSDACFAPDKTQIASCSRDKTIRLWDSRTGLPIGEPLTGPTQWVLCVCFSPDGTLLASGSKDGSFWLWDVRSRRLIAGPLQEHTDWLRTICFSPDGSRVVSGSNDNTMIVWDIGNAQPIIPPLRDHTDAVLHVCTSPDGKRIASSSWDKTIRLWDACTGQALLAPLEGHTAPVFSVAFSPNGLYLASSSNDRTIRLWDAQSGQSIGYPLTGHALDVGMCYFSSNNLMVTDSSDVSIRTWDISDLIQAKEPDVGSLAHDLAQSTTDTQALGMIFREDGWVTDSQSRLLTWVPPDLRPITMHPRNTRLISTQNLGSVQIGFEFTKLGESWAEIYKR